MLDFTIAWAGPMATRILAHLGATVLKVEALTRMDAWRGYEGVARRRFPNGQYGERWYDRNAWFNTQSHDKLSLGLDLKKPRARKVAERAVRWADMAVANFAPGTLDRLHLGFSDMAAINDRIVLIEMPAFGNDGPLSAHKGMGQTMESASGMASLMGYEDGDPTLTGTAYIDPVGGLHGAAAALAGLQTSRRTGRPQYVEVAQVEAALHWIGPQLLACFEGAWPGRPLGNASDQAAPHDAYRCAGTDEWVAIHVDSDTSWSALCRLIGRADIQDAPLFRTVADRNENRAELRQHIEQWSMHQPKWTAAEELQGSGIKAAPVATGQDAALNPHLWARGFFSVLSHDEAGTHPYPGLSVRWGARAQPMLRAAPPFGRDSRYILSDLLGFAEDEIAELEATKTVAQKPSLTFSPGDPA